MPCIIFQHQHPLQYRTIARSTFSPSCSRSELCSHGLHQGPKHRQGSKSCRGCVSCRLRWFVFGKSGGVSKRYLTWLDFMFVVASFRIGGGESPNRLSCCDSSLSNSPKGLHVIFISLISSLHSALSNTNISSLTFPLIGRFNQVKPKNEVEARVYEVLSHKNWGASTTLMNEIAQDTSDYERCEFLYPYYSKPPMACVRLEKSCIFAYAMSTVLSIKSPMLISHLLHH